MNGVYFQHEQRSEMKVKRNAGMSKGKIMNRLATSKEDILAASRELIMSLQSNNHTHRLSQ